MVELKGARVFITGGAGFIGSHIADAVLAAGAARVVSLDDYSRGRKENLGEALAAGGLEMVEGDICDRELVRGLTEGADIVFHQAAQRITQAAEDPRRALEVMVMGTQNVLDAAVDCGVKRVVSASSASIYGEPSYLPMDEAHPFNNRTVYGAAKIANEQMHRAYAEMHGLRYVMLRPFNVYGTRMDTHGAYTEVMVRWMERLAAGETPVVFGDGSQTMDFVSVRDVARAYLLAATSEATDVCLNVGTGIETSLLKLSGLLAAAMGHPEVQPELAPARAVNGVTRRRADTALARKLLGFEATVGLEQGLGELAAWFLAQRDPALAW